VNEYHKPPLTNPSQKQKHEIEENVRLRPSHEESDFL
jgi:hypothetical protein